MKTFRSFLRQMAFTAGILFSTVAVATAQTSNRQASKTATASSLLWKIEGNGLQKPSYLFGTIHMICEKDFVMKQKIIEGMNQTAQTYLEINLADPNLAAETQQHMLGTQPLSAQLSEEDALYLDTVFKQKLKTPLSAVDHIKGGILIGAIVQMNQTCKMVSFEERVIQHFTQANQPIHGLSTVAEQYSFLDKIFETKDLANYLRMMESEQMKISSEQLNKAYLDENIEALNDILKNFNATNLDQYHQLTTVRNKLWAQRMPDIMKDDATFFAIGAGHLSGEFGLIALLRNAGYRVTPVI